VLSLARFRARDDAIAPVARSDREMVQPGTSRRHHHLVTMRDLPSGTVTFCFTDVEGSTRLVKELGPECYAQALAKHRLTLRSAFSSHGGVEVDTQGDALFYVFAEAEEALRACAKAQQALDCGPIRVRIGLHTGESHRTDEGYVGEDVHLAARVAACGHGGQVLVSSVTAALLNCELTDLGEHRLKYF
jgi:class 3 adenylate cyclase